MPEAEITEVLVPLTDEEKAQPGSMFLGLTPKGIRQILKAPDVVLTEDDLDVAFGIAYPDTLDPRGGSPTPDYENPNHVRTLDVIEARRKLIREEAMREGQQARIYAIDTARESLTRQGFDVSILSEDDLAKIGFEMGHYVQEYVKVPQETRDVLCYSEEQVIDAVVSIDEETGAWMTEGGIVVGYRDEDSRDVETFLRNRGERITGLRAQLAAAEKEKQVWIDQINARFDPKINKVRNTLNWNVATTLPVAKAHIEAFNARLAAQIAEDEALGRKSRVKLVRHLDVDLLRVQLTKTKDKVEVANDAKVIEALRSLVANPESGMTDIMVEGFINRKETIAKSAFTDYHKAFLSDFDVPGLTFIKGGEDKVELK